VNMTENEEHELRGYLGDMTSIEATPALVQTVVELNDEDLAELRTFLGYA
jgi:hypothetical protein